MKTRYFRACVLSSLRLFAHTLGACFPYFSGNERKSIPL